MNTISSFFLPFIILWVAIYLVGLILSTLGIYTPVPIGTGY